jgi:hypothetical protein
MNTIQLLISLKNLFLEVNDCCICVKSTCFFKDLSCLFFVCSALRTCCSNCNFMEHPILSLQARHIMILPLTVKESSIFTHKFKFDIREDTTSAIIYQLRKPELNSLNCSYKTKITFKNFRTRMWVVRSRWVCLECKGTPFSLLEKSPMNRWY